MPRDEAVAGKRKKRPRPIGAALLEGLENRVLLSATPHWVERAVTVIPDFSLAIAAPIARSANAFATADNSAGAPALAQDVEIVSDGGKASAEASSSGIVSGQAAELFSAAIGSSASATGVEPAPVDPSKDGNVSAQADWWSHGGGLQVDFGTVQETGAPNSGDRSGVTVLITARADYRRVDQDTVMPVPPPPAPPVVNVTGAAAVNGQASAASIDGAGAAITISPRLAALQQGGQGGSARAAMPGNSLPIASVVANSAATPLIATPVATSSAETSADFSWAQGVWGIDTGLTAFTELLERPEVLASAGQSVDFMEKLLISDATALAQVANGVALRLYEEDALLWKGAAGLLGVVMIVAAGASHQRVASQVPKRQRRNRKHLCVGEESLVAAEY